MVDVPANGNRFFSDGVGRMFSAFDLRASKQMKLSCRSSNARESGRGRRSFYIAINFGCFFALPRSGCTAETVEADFFFSFFLLKHEALGQCACDKEAESTIAAQIGHSFSPVTS